MSRIRTIKPDLFRSPSMRHLPLEARFFMVGLITEADDEGRFIASSRALAGTLFPHDDNVTVARVERWLHLIAGIGSVVLYEADGVRYGYFPMWAEHQRISHPTPSRLPSPSGEIPERFRNGSALKGKEGNREQGTGKSAIAEAFEEFWKASPRREGKIAARAAFEKSAKLGAEPRLMVSAMRLYAEQMQREGRDRSKIKLPTTWLNAGCWEDDYGDPRKPTREEIAAEIAALGAEVEP